MGDLGKFIRKVRKEKGLRLEDLSDDQISTATISNIERGVPHVNREKIVYLLQKLSIQLKDIPELLDENTENLESLQLRFFAIESLIHFGKVKKAYQSLLDISENYSSYSLAQIHVLKGKYFLQAGEWKKAEKEFQESIRLCTQDMSNKNNLESMIYYYLAQCSYHQHHFDQAIRRVEKGLYVYEDGLEDSEQIKFLLMTKRILYLEKAGRTDEALKRLEEVWNELNEVKRQDILLRLYVLKADLFRRIKLYLDAVRFAREGIRLATNTPYTDELFELWTILGATYIELNHLEDAEICFAFVREMEEKVQNKNELVRAYCSLGNLYLLQGKTEEAKQVIYQAICWGEKINDPSKLCNALLIMGKLLKTIHQEYEAIHYLERAVAVAENVGLKEKSFLAFYELAGCYEKMGERDRFQQATEQMYHLQRQLEEGRVLAEVW